MTGKAEEKFPSLNSNVKVGYVPNKCVKRSHFCHLGHLVIFIHCITELQINFLEFGMCQSHAIVLVQIKPCFI